MPHKIINLNTARPEVIAFFLMDYYNRPDELAKIGLPGRMIDELGRATSFATPYAWLVEGKLVPPAMLNIPGDMYLDSRILGAPPVNRLMGLWDSYGGWYSLIAHLLMWNEANATTIQIMEAGRQLTGVEIGSFPQGRAMKFNYLLENWLFSGYYSGFNYSAYVSSGGDANAGLVGATYAPADKQIVPSSLRRYSEEDRLRIFNFNKINAGLEQSLTLPYSKYGSPGLMAATDSMGGQTTAPVDMDTGSTSSVGIYSGTWAPWIEYPDVWDGVTYRPLESPIGKYYLKNDTNALKDWYLELNEHYKAIKEWFDAGCICDWPDWGGYKDPQSLIEQTVAETKVVEESTKHVPTTTSSTVPPPNPKVGDMWFNAITGKTKVFHPQPDTSGLQPSGSGVWVES